MIVNNVANVLAELKLLKHMKKLTQEKSLIGAHSVICVLSQQIHSKATLKRTLE